MNLYHMDENTIEPVPATRFADHGIRERDDLQRLLREAIQIVAPGTMVLDEEFDAWEDSRRRIDLLCLDRQANLVVVELKRTEDGGHMELQALRYAAMVAHMTFEQAVAAHRRYLDKCGLAAQDPRLRILAFLGWEQPYENAFAGDVRIVLVSQDFSTELTTAVLWLNERQLDIRCVRMLPFKRGQELLVWADQCLPLPSAEAYQVRLREKAVSQRAAQPGPWTGFWFMNVGSSASAHRAWADCRHYGFMIGGSDEASIRQMQKPQPGDHVLAYEVGSGYVGVGQVTAAAVPQRDFVVASKGKRLVDLPLTTTPDPEALADDDRCDWCVGIQWMKTVEPEQAILRHRAYRGTLCKIHQADLIEQVMRAWDLELPDLT